ncbi:uncharacterized protein FFE2_16045 [Fusarium fujikuroi]|nr:uncharacterized protein FFE2_16045 [Fusarium fujikuroi]
MSTSVSSITNPKAEKTAYS